MCVRVLLLQSYAPEIHINICGAVIMNLLAVRQPVGRRTHSGYIEQLRFFKKERYKDFVYNID